MDLFSVSIFCNSFTYYTICVIMLVIWTHFIGSYVTPKQSNLNILFSIAITSLKFGFPCHISNSYIRIPPQASSLWLVSTEIWWNSQWNIPNTRPGQPSLCQPMLKALHISFETILCLVLFSLCIYFKNSLKKFETAASLCGPRTLLMYVVCGLPHTSCVEWSCRVHVNTC